MASTRDKPSRPEHFCLAIPAEGIPPLILSILTTRDLCGAAVRISASACFLPKGGKAPHAFPPTLLFPDGVPNRLRRREKQPPMAIPMRYAAHVAVGPWRRFTSA